ncbi:MAG: hypothetical protein JJ956_17955, partial [Pseudomonadales bacterium]|nr:hypothetical protein [Pseudomonadales bacterium]
FNPGWDQQAQETAEFTDVRTIQSALESAGLELATRVEEGTSGPGSVMLQDPDGNQILIDQHR